MKAIFCGIYAKKEDEVFILLNSRWDGKFGFAGGFVDENESLEKALQREIFEELGFELKEENFKIEYIKKINSLEIYFIPFKVTFEEFEEIISNIHKSKHFLEEIMGYSVLRLKKTNLKKSKQFENLSSCVIKDVEDELEFLLKRINDD